MIEHDVLVRLRAGNPIPSARAERAAGAPWVEALRERILAIGPAPAEVTLRRRARSLQALAAAGLLLVGGGTVAANEIRNAVETAPDTPAGALYAQDLLQRFRDSELPGAHQPDITPVPESARVVFSARTRHGEYTIWRARTEGSRGGALIFSSPRLGISGSIGASPRPRPPYIVVRGGLASPPGGARELFGQVSASVAAVRVELKDGRRGRAIVAAGWFVFSQDIGHARPARLVGLDRRGRVVTVVEKGLP